jgi:dienelactone hydrolase
VTRNRLARAIREECFLGVSLAMCLVFGFLDPTQQEPAGIVNLLVLFSSLFAVLVGTALAVARHGYDNTAEELYASAYPALDRCWAFVGLDGPGQGSVLYDRREPQRPDWEHVVPGMFDLVAGLPQVDPRRIVLVGRSFGGLLAPRGAAGTPRLAALIVDPGQYDMAAGIAARLGDLWHHVGDPAAKAKFDALLEIPALRTLLGPRMMTNGVADPQAYFQDMRRYTNAEQAAAITCASLVTDNETDLVSTGQGRQLYDAMTCPKTFRRFTRAEGAEGHCEGMAPIVFWTAAFDWLDTTGCARA